MSLLTRPRNHLLLYLRICIFNLLGINTIGLVSGLTITANNTYLESSDYVKIECTTGREGDYLTLSVSDINCCQNCKFTGACPTVHCSCNPDNVAIAEITSITASFIDTWTCRSPYGDSVSLQLQHYVPSTVTLETPYIIKENEATLFDCKATGGDPAPLTYIWYLDGNIIPDENSDAITLVLTRNNYNISCAVRQLDYKTPVASGAKILDVKYRPGSAILQKNFVKKIHSTFDITCAINDTGVPAADYKWRKNGVDTGQSGSVYCLSDITIHDEASYECIPYNIIGDGMPATTDVIVYDDASNIDDLPNVLDVNNTDDQFSVTCAFTAIPAATIKWYKDGNLLPTNILKAEYKTKNNPDMESYTITTSTITWNTDDETTRKGAKGSYKCVADHPYGLNLETTEMKLDVLYPPFGIPHLTVSSPVVSVFDTVIFKCDLPPEVEGNPSCNQFHLIRQDGTNWTNTSTIWTHETDSVTFTGQYFCEAANMLGVTSRSNYIQLQVYAPALIENTISQLQIPIYDYSTFYLSCIGSGTNRNITWRRYDDDITKYFFPPEEEYVHENYTHGQTTALKSVLRWKPPESDATCNTMERRNGIYDCVVAAVMTDHISYHTTTFTIKVQYPALWKGTDKTNITEIGRTDAFIYCNVCASPSPENFTWSRSGYGLRHGIRIDHDRIHFDEIISDDFGMFTCNAINTINGSEYEQSFEIKLVSAGSPEQPHLLQVLPNISSVSISVSWIAGRNMGYEQFFKVEYKISMDDDFQMVTDNIADNKSGNIFSLTINNLKSATTYTISVLAYNTWTGGVNYSTPALVTASTIDGPQIAIHRIFIGRTVVSLFWSVESGNVTELQLNFHGGDSEDNYVTLRDGIPTTDNPILASHDDLDPKKTYSFQLLYYEGNLTYTSHNGEVIKYQPSRGLSGLEIAGITLIILVCVAAVSGVIAILYRRRWFSRFKCIKSKAGHSPTNDTHPNSSCTPYENCPKTKPEMYEDWSQAGVSKAIPTSEYSTLDGDQNHSSVERMVYEELQLEVISD